MNPWQNSAHDIDPAHRTDHLHLLTLFLELQLDLLLVALRPAGTGASAGPRWDGETLDLTGVDPEPDQRAWLAARYMALGAAIDEMLGNPEVRRNSAVVARLREARATCSERLAGLPAPRPESGPESRRESRRESRPQAGVETGLETGALIEAGHYLG